MTFWILQGKYGDILRYVPNDTNTYAKFRQNSAYQSYYKNSSGDEIANVNFCTTTTYM